MKWIGQHIYDFISRFRNDVYLEDISTGTIASGGNLGLDSNNKIVKSANPAGTIDLTSEVTGVLPVTNGGTGASSLADNSILTGTGTSAITAESTLTYNSVISLLTLSSTASSLPQFVLSNSNTDAAGSKFKFQKTAVGADDDIIGVIDWTADDDGGTAISYATMQAEIADASNNDEAGKLELKVTTNSTEHQQALTATGLGTGSRVDIGLGHGDTSTTTIAGDLQVVGGDINGPTDGDLRITSDGSVVINVDNDNDETNQDIRFVFNGSTDGFLFNPSRGAQEQYSTSSGTYPLIYLQNTGDNATGAGHLNFNKKRTDTSIQVGEDNDLIGKTKYTSYNDNGTPELITYAEVQGTIADASDSDEAGKYEVKVTTSNGTTSALQNALSAVGSPSDNDVDITVGYGTTSTTTIAGTLTMGSTAFANNSGVIQVATQGTIDHDSLANFVANEHIDWTGDVSASSVIHTNNITDLHGAGVNGSANQLLTDDGDGTVTSEAGLTYDADVLYLQDQTNGFKPELKLENRDSAATKCSLINFIKTKGAPGADGDQVGIIYFSGDNSLQQNTGFAQITAGVATALDTDEAGTFKIYCATSNGTQSYLKEAFTLTGHDTGLYVDASIGFGGSSTVAIAGDAFVKGNIQLGNLTDTTISRSAAGTVQIEGSTIVTAANQASHVPQTIQVDFPKYLGIYVLYMNTQNYWYNSIMYSTSFLGNVTPNGSSISATYQARGATYIAPSACVVNKVSLVFQQVSSYLSGDINLEFALVKWTPQDDTANTTTLTEMTITNHDGAFTETDVHVLHFDVTSNAASTLAAGDCIAFLARTTTAPSSGSLVRNVCYGHGNFEIIKSL